MVNLIGNFSLLDKRKILVAGDLMLDTYTLGKARRISPEAPVAVIEAASYEERPGGAGNTILNLVSMGAEVIAFGRVGKDSAGKSLLKALVQENVSIEGIIEEESFKTPIKNRIIADGQQIVRVDHEEIKALSKEAEREILKKLPSLLTDVEAIAISDYGKGFLSDVLLKELISLARAHNIFIIADPKGNDFGRYYQVDLIKPNLKEAYLAAHLDPSASLEEVASRLLTKTGAKYLMVTRSEQGISLFESGKPQLDFPVAAKQVKDVTGAGDTVLAMLTLALASKLPLQTAIQFSNIAAGIAIEKFGCARITLSELATRLLEIDTANKVFDDKHLEALKAALANHPCSLVYLSSMPTSSIIQFLTEHKAKTGHAILAALPSFNQELLHILTALKPIDFILLNANEASIHQHFPELQLLIPTRNVDCFSCDPAGVVRG